MKEKTLQHSLILQENRAFNSHRLPSTVWSFQVSQLGGCCETIYVRERSEIEY